MPEADRLRHIVLTEDNLKICELLSSLTKFLGDDPPSVEIMPSKAIELSQPDKPTGSNPKLLRPKERCCFWVASDDMFSTGEMLLNKSSSTPMSIRTKLLLKVPIITKKSKKRITSTTTMSTSEALVLASISKDQVDRVVQVTRSTIDVRLSKVVGSSWVEIVDDMGSFKRMMG